MTFLLIKFIFIFTYKKFFISIFILQLEFLFGPKKIKSSFQKLFSDRNFYLQEIEFFKLSEIQLFVKIATTIPKFIYFG